MRLGPGHDALIGTADLVVAGLLLSLVAQACLVPFLKTPRGWTRRLVWACWAVPPAVLLGLLAVLLAAARGTEGSAGR